MNILFVCTGNTCRSPMAEALARHLFPEEFTFASAGIAAAAGVAPSLEAIEVMRELHIDITAHRSRQFTAELAAQYDMVLTMTAGHVDRIKELYDVAADTLAARAGGDEDIGDPFLGDIGLYRRTRDQLRGLLEQLKEKLEEE